MMILRFSPFSPFVRKVRIAAAILKLDHEITLEAADTLDPNDSLRRQNPLGKIPTLITEEGDVLYDSRVIVEYLDYRAGGGRIVPRKAAQRFAALRLQALCDGVLDAAILRIYETRFRPPERHEPAWIAHQSEKITRALATLEAEPPQFGGVPDVGAIALACVLGYLDLRFPGTWRETHPRLVAWHDAFAAAVPAFAQTKAEA